MRPFKAVKFYQNKVYLDVVVFKPRTNVDCINFIDVVADVLKRVIMVDDKYFCIKSWTYEMDKINPRMIIKLYQPTRRNLK